ncbi:hypothetical protein VRK_28570 [Vibrio sp. MEBiC08052]|nr:hypothetical protein VRK_28570 [Vibrio sp. MEBiC08052]
MLAVHPRMYGEHIQKITNSILLIGSSPYVRGTLSSET